MSIERELGEAYRRSASKLKRPHYLDQKIERQYREGVYLNRKLAGKARWPLRIALVSVFLLIMGFSLPYADPIKDAIVHFMHHNARGSTYDVKTAQTTRESLARIKSQLNTGERALYYSSELERLLPKTTFIPFVIVSNPQVWKEKADWDKQLRCAGIRRELPLTIGGAFAFREGMNGPPFGGVLTEAESDLLEGLKLLALQRNEPEAWAKLQPARDGGNIYTSVYESKTKGVVYVEMELFEEKTDMTLYSDIKVHERLAIEGVSAGFIRSERYLLHPSNQYKSLIWLESGERGSVLFTIGSGDERATKADLIGIARSLLPRS
ncbi:hypothetical protein [Paenibacillus arenilitoris]|uniref:DUF4367 domain-containing protein n=1 Tax=Paenibacillus arenilitoris TaxID=2772299 RepID=A0A927CKW4_9BACL|nr:hypothetical protein [Paenibacillus arenilitoris]MBD2869924.1 hypothetical protein [Paenibacillus arenilitoris]